MTKLKFKNEIFKSSNKSSFYNFFHKIYIKIFFEKKQQYGCRSYKKKKKNWLSIAKMLQNAKKRFISIIRNYFTLENLTSLYRKVKEKLFFCTYV